jgi:hypothetical protein
MFDIIEAHQQGAATDRERGDRQRGSFTLRTSEAVVPIVTRNRRESLLALSEAYAERATCRLRRMLGVVDEGVR